MNKKLVAVALSALLCCQLAAAADATCEARASEKKLAGAAKNSFLKKCDADTKKAAEDTCVATAAEKKLKGAAKNSFVKKCVADAATPAP